MLIAVAVVVAVMDPSGASQVVVAVVVVAIVAVDALRRRSLPKTVAALAARKPVLRRG